MPHKTRSTPNRINGDFPMNLLQRAVYFGFNIVEELRPQPTLSDVIPFRIEASAYPGDCLARTASPSRILSNLFWLGLPVEAIEAALGTVRIVDVGCGKGGYAKLFAKRFGTMESYLGIDVERRDAWDRHSTRDPRCRFVAAPAESITDEVLGDATLIVSQSALEHFPEDLTFAGKVGGWAASADRPILQLHILPGPKNWRQYGTHGFRGYTKRALAGLIDAFQPRDHRVFVLGGKACNEVHYRWIYDRLNRSVRDRRAADTDAYSTALATALADDAARLNDSVDDACFLVLATMHGDGELLPALQRHMAP